MSLEQELKDNETSEENLNNFLNSLKDYEPIIPDEITRYFISKGGVDTKDPRIVRLFSIISQKLVSDVLLNAKASAELRGSNSSSKGGKDRSKSGEGDRLTLTVEDLNAALEEFGLGCKKPPYYS